MASSATERSVLNRRNAKPEGGHSMAMQDTRANGGSGSSGAGNGTLNQVKEAGGQVINQATEKVSEFVDQAKPQVQNQIDSQRERVAENLGNTASTLRETSQQL